MSAARGRLAAAAEAIKLAHQFVRKELRKLGHETASDEADELGRSAIERFIKRECVEAFDRPRAQWTLALRRIAEDKAKAYVRREQRRAGEAPKRPRADVGTPAGFTRRTIRSTYEVTIPAADGCGPPLVRVAHEDEHTLLLSKPGKHKPTAWVELDDADALAVADLEDFVRGLRQTLEPLEIVPVPCSRGPAFGHRRAAWRGELPEKERDAFRTAYEAVFGYPVAEREWYRGARSLAGAAYASMTGFAGTVPLEAWATADDLRRVVEAAQLGRGGGQHKGGRPGKASIAKAVIALVNVRRKQAKKRPLPVNALRKLLGP